MSNPNLYRTLSQEEMRNINGGLPWKAIGKFIIQTGAAAAIEKCVSDIIDWVKKTVLIKREKL